MVFLGMKRAREDNITTMANCLMLLSRTNDLGTVSNAPTRVFECKTCNRQFPSFQALGGHRASHKKPRLMAGESNAAQIQSPAKPKTHECSVCGQEFAIGQALGGHMRRHRATMEDNQTTPLSLFPTQVGGGVPVLKRSNSKRVMQQENQASPLSLFPTQVPKVLKRSTSRRVLCLDLNLAPPENNDCKYERADSILY